MNVAPNSPPPSITDSAWYWVYLFCTAGAVALLLAGPKFAVRQSQIERNGEDRLRVAHYVAGQPIDISEQATAEPATTRITLWPLYVVLGCVLSVAWFNLWRSHRRGHRLFASPDEATR